MTALPFQAFSITQAQARVSRVFRTYPARFPHVSRIYKVLPMVTPTSYNLGLFSIRLRQDNFMIHGH